MHFTKKQLVKDTDFFQNDNSKRSPDQHPVKTPLSEGKHLFMDYQTKDFTDLFTKTVDSSTSHIFGFFLRGSVCLGQFIDSHIWRDTQPYVRSNSGEED